ncbi:embryogenesis-like protein [Rutidosis leptorrhynchoides]|uniref:embryogenesis-like protein n=1 Tax=Rutidosis leptorrhynchoides TaxID=125765 RepID=UPI003A99CD40
MHQRIHISVCKFISRYPFKPSSKPISPIVYRSFKTQSFNNPTKQFFKKPLLYTQFNIFRSYNVETDKVVDEINLKFAEAREEIETAMESKETVYFNEEAECARAVVKDVLDMYDGLLSKLPEKERGGIQRSMGLKIEQLKAELEQLNE